MKGCDWRGNGPRNDCERGGAEAMQLEGGERHWEDEDGDGGRQEKAGGRRRAGDGEWEMAGGIRPAGKWAT